MDSLLQLAR